MVRLLVLIGLALISFGDTSVAAPRRVALVVGAGEYGHAPALAHTLNDAREVAAALTRLEFDVDLILNPDRTALENAVRRLGQRSRGADASLFYFSGHALEAQRVNWLLPVSADIKADDDLRFEALDLAAVLEQIESKAHVSLLFLDACREDPFKQRFGAARGTTRAGLAPANATASGSYIAFATAPGNVAEDGNGPHSPFTAALLKFMETPGLEVRQMMSRVRGAVEEETDGKQIPWDSSSLLGDFYFDPKTTGERVIREINGPNPQVDLDALFWESIKNSKNPRDFSAYLLKFPQGVFAELARNRLAELNATPAVTVADPKLLNALSALMPSVQPKSREDFATAYQASSPHKSMAANPTTGGYSRVSQLPSEQEAEDSVLERCEVTTGTPCVLVAVDGSIKYASGDAFNFRQMPRVHYSGPFNPERIPNLPQETRRRPDVVDYGSAADYKAVAYHPRGYLHIVSRAPNQHAAEEQVLAACNKEPHGEGAGPCYLYASGDTVVLWRHSTAPVTGAVTPQTEVVKPPVVTPPRDAVPLHEAIVAQFERSLPAMTAQSRDLLAKAYESALVHKALAVRPNGGTYRFVAWPSVEGAELATLEGCQVYYGGPCALLASDDLLHGDASGNLATRDMTRVRYAGNFAVEQIPAITPAVRGSDGVQSYAAAPAAKAMAFHPWGQIFSVTGAATQNEAETRALAACNGDAAHKVGMGGPCYLYAVGGQVVLSRRLREPLTPATAPVTPPPVTPPPAPASKDDAALRDALVQRLANISPNTARVALETSVARYLSAPADHRAIAAAEGTIGVGAQPTIIAAETMALEKCQLLRGAPCALLGSGREIAPPSPPPGSKWSVRDMPALSYNGYFEVFYLPGVDDTVRNRPDVAGYYLAPISKAAAIGVGGLVVVTQAKSQFEAESQALATCGSGCWLYAAGNQVVLRQRRTTPRPLGGSIADVISYLLANDQGPSVSAEYSKFRTHRALVALPESGQRFIEWGIDRTDWAEHLAFETCYLIYNASCVLIATDDAPKTNDPSTAPRRTTQRLVYQGPYRADMVPLYETTPKEANEYAAMREPKAMAIRPIGPKIAIAGGRTLAEAEAAALARCTDANSPYPCFIYAANGQTILPQRRTEPTR